MNCNSFYRIYTKPLLRRNAIYNPFSQRRIWSNFEPNDQHQQTCTMVHLYLTIRFWSSLQSPDKTPNYWRFIKFSNNWGLWNPCEWRLNYVCSWQTRLWEKNILNNHPRNEEILLWAIEEQIMDSFITGKVLSLEQKYEGYFQTASFQVAQSNWNFFLNYWWILVKKSKVDRATHVVVPEAIRARIAHIECYPPISVCISQRRMYD